MLNSHTIIIGALAVILSFSLYILGDNYLAESVKNGKIVQYCESRQPYCEYKFLGKESEMVKKYGAPYRQLALEYKRKKLFVVIPFLLLIIALFVGFTIDEKERLFVAITICPFLIYFMNRFIYNLEFRMGPVYMLFAVLATTSFVSVKRKLIFRNP